MIKDPQESIISSISFRPSPTIDPILVIREDGFWVRGVKVKQDEHEAAIVYKAFKQFMVEAELRRKW